MQLNNPFSAIMGIIKREEARIRGTVIVFFLYLSLCWSWSFSWSWSLSWSWSYLCLCLCFCLGVSLGLHFDLDLGLCPGLTLDLGHCLCLCLGPGLCLCFYCGLCFRLGKQIFICHNCLGILPIFFKKVPINEEQFASTVFISKKLYSIFLSWWTTN